MGLKCSYWRERARGRERERESEREKEGENLTLCPPLHPVHHAAEGQLCVGISQLHIMLNGLAVGNAYFEK